MDTRIVCFDIESTHLRANFGHIICASFLDLFDPRAKVVTFRIDDPKFRRPRRTDDTKVLAAIKEYLEDSFVWCGWYSHRFDERMINGRLCLTGQTPLERRLHIDLWKHARRLNFHSHRLDAVAKSFELKEQKTDLLPSTWLRAGEGEVSAIDYVVKHCEQDVKGLKEVFPIIAPFIQSVRKPT